MPRLTDLQLCSLLLACHAHASIPDGSDSFMSHPLMQALRLGLPIADVGVPSLHVLKHSMDPCDVEGAAGARSRELNVLSCHACYAACSAD